MKLIQGDCLEKMKLIPDVSVDAIITDLPYGTTACKWDSVIPFDEMWEQLNRIIKPNGAMVLTASQPFTSNLVMSNPNMFKYCWSWKKSLAGNFAHIKNSPLKVHEDICVFSKGVVGHKTQTKKRMTYNPQGVKVGNRLFSGEGSMKKSEHNMYRKSFYNGRKTDGSNYPGSVIEFSNASNKNRGLHPTQKPVALMEYLIKTYTHEGETVLDFTMGSGTTGVACKNLNRNFIGIELDEEYFKIAEDRIKNYQVQPDLGF